MLEILSSDSFEGLSYKVKQKEVISFVPLILPAKGASTRLEKDGILYQTWTDDSNSIRYDYCIEVSDPNEGDIIE